MSTPIALHRTFARLHRPGAPLILFNAWDAGSAAAIARAGAAAIATGSWSVAAAHGMADGEVLPWPLVLANAQRIVAATDLPVSIDIEGGYAATLDGLEANGAALAGTGAVGCNLEDGLAGTHLRAADAQAQRIAAFRRGAGAAMFVNARTDVFLLADRAAHDRAMADAAIERGHAYAEAGADGLFVPGVVDLKLIERIVRAVPLPVNVIAVPGSPAPRALAEAGVARISHGPWPYRAMLRALEEAAAAALR